MPDLENIDPVTGTPPETRIKDASSLNAVVKRIVLDDSERARARANVQKMLDGEPPYIEQSLIDTGQEGRCNLNFGDGKARVKSETTGYYDLTDSVPMLAMLLPDMDPQLDVSKRAGWSQTMSEEWHRTLKEWADFDGSHQLNVQYFCSHGLGFLYFRDNVNWEWSVASLADFKVPNGASLTEAKNDIAVCLAPVTVGELYSWIKDVDASDKRWNLDEVHKALINCSNFDYPMNGLSQWEHWQTITKNNDIFTSVTAKDTVKIATAWVREFSGKISMYITLQDGSNMDFLFKCLNMFDNVNQCFNFFPYEIGTNGTLHAVRGLAQEIYPHAQVLNNLRCQAVDNAKLSGSLLIQPKTEADAEDLSILFYGGAAIIPANVTVTNGQLNNPSTGMLPVINDMTLLMRRNTSDVPSNQPEGQRDKTKFEVQSDLTKESKIPAASMALFYLPWKRHLTEVYRRFQNKALTKKDKSYDSVMGFRDRCIAKGVPKEVLFAPTRVIPVRAIGAGSPSSRLLAYERFTQYYGNLDPVGQNNLMRAIFAQEVGYDMVDLFVPKFDETGRMPVDVEIAELQNDMMQDGKMPSVLPNDAHILHVQTHNPSLANDLGLLESGQGSPEILTSAQTKIQHVAKHMQFIKPDKLNKTVVMELTRQFNNLAERVGAAVKSGQYQQQDQSQGVPTDPKLQQKQDLHELDMKQKVESHQLELRLQAESAAQNRAIADADAAQKLNFEASKARLLGQIASPSTPVPPAATLPVPAGPAPVAPTTTGTPPPQPAVTTSTTAPAGP